MCMDNACVKLQKEKWSLKLSIPANKVNSIMCIIANPISFLSPTHEGANDCCVLARKPRHFPTTERPQRDNLTITLLIDHQSKSSMVSVASLTITAFILLCLLNVVSAHVIGGVQLENATSIGSKDGQGQGFNATSNALKKRRQKRRRTRRYRRPVDFYAHADTNYAKEERELFPTQVKNIPRSTEFIVHLGDMKGADHCKNDGPYKFVADTYIEHAKAPVFLVPGDNDWYDCGGPSDRKRGFAIWESHFQSLYQNFGTFSSVHHHNLREENFAFFRRRVLFIGVHLLGGDIKNKKEWNALLKDDLQWTREMVEKYKRRPRVVVIFGKALSIDCIMYMYIIYILHVRMYV